jgi:hypothetical protein
MAVVTVLGVEYQSGGDSSRRDLCMSASGESAGNVLEYVWARSGKIF